MNKTVSIKKAPEKEAMNLYDEMVLAFERANALTSFIYHAASGSVFEIENEELGIMASMLTDEMKKAETAARAIAGE